MKDIGQLLNRISENIKRKEPPKRPIYDPKQVVHVMQMINPMWHCGELELRVVDALTNSDNWVILQGNKGSGKSMLVRLWARAINEITAKNVITLTTDECGLAFTTNGSQILNHFIKSDLILDELGIEPETFGHYNDKMDVIGQIIRIKYENRRRLIGTTNLTRSQLMSRYGDRIIERFEELGFIFIFKDVKRPVLSKFIDPDNLQP